MAELQFASLCVDTCDGRWVSFRFESVAVVMWMSYGRSFCFFSTDVAVGEGTCIILHVVSRRSERNYVGFLNQLERGCLYFSPTLLLTCA